MMENDGVRFVGFVNVVKCGIDCNAKGKQKAYHQKGNRLVSELLKHGICSVPVNGCAV
jgi:hypothetical protein